MSILSNAKVMHAFHRAIPVTMKRNVQKIRAEFFKWKDNIGAGDPTEHAGKKLFIRHVDLSANVPFVRLNDKKSSLMVSENWEPAPGTERRGIELHGLMIPIAAIKEIKPIKVPKAKKHRIAKAAPRPAPKIRIAVWWVSQADCEATGPRLKRGTPKYIQSQFRSRWGVSGRRRLWADPQFGGIDLSDQPEARFNVVPIDAAGIVIWRKDAKHVLGLPGMVTDHKIVQIEQKKPKKKS